MLALAVVTGCGKPRTPTYPASGVVRFKGGEPVTSGTVEFLSTDLRLNARGEIRGDGSFCLTTFRDGDGAVKGEHRAIVIPFVPGGDALLGHTMHEQRPAVSRTYANYETSGLAFTVRPDGINKFEIVVEPAALRR